MIIVKRQTIRPILVQHRQIILIILVIIVAQMRTIEILQIIMNLISIDLKKEIIRKEKIK